MDENHSLYFKNHLFSFTDPCYIVNHLSGSSIDHLEEDQPKDTLANRSLDFNISSSVNA